MTFRLLKIILPAALMWCICPQSADCKDFETMKQDFIGRSRVGFCVEWGYTGTFMHKYHNDYVDSTDGYRIDVRDTDFLLYSNGLMQAGLFFETTRHYSVAMNVGFAGVFQERRMFPLTLRFSYFFRSLQEDGFFALAEAGKAFVFDGTDMHNNIARLGGGYRISLSTRNNLDFSTFLQLATDHPDIYNMNLGNKVQKVYVNCSDSYYGALVFTVALSF